MVLRGCRLFWLLSFASLVALPACQLTHSPQNQMVRPRIGRFASTVTGIDGIPLQIPGYEASTVMAANGIGQVVGYAYRPLDASLPAQQAFLWDGAGLVQLAGLDGSDGSSMAYDIDDRSTVVGLATNASGIEVATVWRDGAPEAIAVPSPGEASRATAINEAGQIAGVYDGGSRAFLWENGEFHDIAPDPRVQYVGLPRLTEGGVAFVQASVHVGCNWQYCNPNTDVVFVWRGGLEGQIAPFSVEGGRQVFVADNLQDGRLVGFGSSGPGTNTAYLYSEGSTAPLGTLGGKSGWARAINTNEIIVGAAEDSSGVQHPVAWKDGQTIRLGVHGAAYDVNSSDQIVGVLDDSDGTSRAFRADWVSAPVILDSTAGVTSDALEVNDAGWVLGWRQPRDAVGLEGRRAVLWVGDVAHDLPPMAGATASLPTELASESLVIGSSYFASTNASLATIWRIAIDAPPVISIPAVFQGDEGAPVELHLSATDPEGGPVDVRWDLDNDASFVDAVGMTATVTFPNEGTYTIGVQAQDEAGNVSLASATVVVQNVVPSLALSGSPDALRGEEETFQFVATDPGESDVLRVASALCGGEAGGLTFDSATRRGALTCTFETSGTYVVSVSIEDGLGSGEDTLNVKVLEPDTTPPVVAWHANGSAGEDGWYLSDVVITWTVIDEESSVTDLSGCGETMVTTDTEGVTFTCQATSTGGTASESVTIKRDATPPTAAASVTDGTEGSNGWYVTPVAVSFTGSDDTSGLASCSVPAVIDADGEGQIVAGTCTDEAGNTSAPAELSVNVDTTPPSSTPAADPPANGAGWWNGAVVVDFPWTDAASGVDDASCSTSVEVSTEGAGQTANAVCFDLAGNRGTASLADINIDTTPPTASAEASPAANARGWNNTAVTVAFSGQDALSGIAGCTGAATVASEGTDQSASGTCIDVAGNESVPAVAAGIDIDLTPPTGSYTLAGPGGENGWYTGAVTATFAWSDDLSGVDDCDDQANVAGDGAAQSASGHCTDLAGNATDLTTAAIDIDGTPPMVTASAERAPNGNGWYNADVTVAFEGTDATSGLASCDPAMLVSTEGEAQDVTGGCSDQAGNRAETHLLVSLDKTAPTATAAATPSPNGNGWNNTPVTVQFDGSDEIGGSGLEGCDSAVVLTCEGAGQSAAGTCTDRAGNVSAPASADGIDIDMTSPVVDVTGVEDAATYELGSVPTAGCSTTDSLSGVDASASLASVGANANGVGDLTTTCDGATDLAGNTASATVTYHVNYAFGGFEKPLENLPTVNRAKGGSAVPLKFSLHGDMGLAVLAGTPVSRRVACSSSDPISDVDEELLDGPGNAQLVYDPDADEYHLNWQTSKSWARTCRLLQLALDDGGAAHEVKFEFR